ncbi:MAG: hypothetical protein A2390_00820 [Candidatus Liptonbacteria bacterium RIFOXYB1_FULL_36_10]|uniref:Uncharacterized protein n=1 Tax=Candidatus Liptonbacteria bacterium RIFOXYB1_FULL_36_10 TaxID=1798654 RepID=A0A1G2CPX1_9BACT|nr:MAG: hypothetical protein A2390_00820 [Candidatus Liptonbacteria bacterium RIFOXYB1_FULL_36_10]
MWLIESCFLNSPFLSWIFDLYALQYPSFFFILSFLRRYLKIFKKRFLIDPNIRTKNPGFGSSFGTLTFSDIEGVNMSSLTGSFFTINFSSDLAIFGISFLEPLISWGAGFVVGKGIIGFTSIFIHAVVFEFQAYPVSQSQWEVPFIILTRV